MAQRVLMGCSQTGDGFCVPLLKHASPAGAGSLSCCRTCLRSHSLWVRKGFVDDGGWETGAEGKGNRSVKWGGACSDGGPSAAEKESRKVQFSSGNGV